MIIIIMIIIMISWLSSLWYHDTIIMISWYHHYDATSLPSRANFVQTPDCEDCVTSWKPDELCQRFVQWTCFVILVNVTIILHWICYNYWFAISKKIVYRDSKMSLLLYSWENREQRKTEEGQRQSSSIYRSDLLFFAYIIPLFYP